MTATVAYCYHYCPAIITTIVTAIIATFITASITNIVTTSITAIYQIWQNNRIFGAVSDFQFLVGNKKQGRWTDWDQEQLIGADLDARVGDLEKRIVDLILINKTKTMTKT